MGGHINKAEAQERGAKRRSLAKKNVEMQGKHLKKAKMQAKMAAKLISENPSPKNMKLMEKDSKQKDEVKTKFEKSKKREIKAKQDRKEKNEKYEAEKLQKSQ